MQEIADSLDGADIRRVDVFHVADVLGALSTRERVNLRLLDIGCVGIILRVRYGVLAG